MEIRAPCPGESVIVVMDANRTRDKLAALLWAIENVVRRRDTVIVLGILCDPDKRPLCFPFYIWEKLEFSVPSEMTPKVLEQRIVKKREEYQLALQPYYRQLKRNDVKLEVKLAAGFAPKIITVEEAQNTNARWIVLDSHLKRDRVFIYGHVGCNIAVMKSKNVATILPSLAVGIANGKPKMDVDQVSAIQPEKPQPDLISPSSPCWYPLSWSLGYPRKFTIAEIDSITNQFAGENILFEEENVQVYRGIFIESLVLVKCFLGCKDRFWCELKILAKVRHRNILNLVGYCCTDDRMFLLQDFPCNGSLDKHLECDELAKKLSWKVRWHIALGIGSSLRYIQEECCDGPIVNVSISSSHVVLSHNFSPLLANFCSAKWLDDGGGSNAASSVERPIGSPVNEDYLSLDVHSFGVLLLELITGQNALNCDLGVLVDQALHLSECGSVGQMLDQRLIDFKNAREVDNMLSAALLCVRNNSGHRPSISEVLAVIRGERFGILDA